MAVVSSLYLAKCQTNVSSLFRGRLHDENLEVLLPPHKSISSSATFCVHVALDMQLTAQAFRSAEEHSTLSRRVYLADCSEDHIPVWTAKVGGCVEAGDGVGVAAVEDDVGGVGGGDFGCQILEKVST